MCNAGVITDYAGRFADLRHNIVPGEMATKANDPGGVIGPHDRCRARRLTPRADHPYHATPALQQQADKSGEMTRLPVPDIAIREGGDDDGAHCEAAPNTPASCKRNEIRSTSRIRYSDWCRELAVPRLLKRPP